MEPYRGVNDENWDQAQQTLLEAGVTDGLPVVPPTPERIESMLAVSGVDRRQTLGILPPSFAAVSWHDVACNAVLAGCRPEYLRVVGAAVAAMASQEFNLLGIATTTGAATTLVVVNGPVVEQIGMNAEGNAMGPGNRANATIGRAVRLTLQNVGCARPRETDMATLGQPGKYTFCFAENERASPWPPLHSERGFASGVSVVTVIGASGSIEIVDVSSASAADLAQTYAQSMLIAGNIGTTGRLGGGEPLIVIPPEHAQIFQAEGYSKEQAKAAIYQRAVLPVDRLSGAVRDRLRANAAEMAREGILRIAASPKDVMIVVAGGVGRKGAYIPTWSGTTRAVSRAVPPAVPARAG
jgi:hypothetical protein